MELCTLVVESLSNRSNVYWASFLALGKKNTSKTKALWEQGQNKEAKTKRLIGNLFAVSEVKITWVKSDQILNTFERFCKAQM